MGSVVVTVPAKPEYVHIVRTVVAGAAAKASLGIDEIEDVRLAVDEACAHLLALAPTATLLSVEIVEGSPAMEIIARVDADISPPSGENESITWHILSALTDGARLEPSPSGTCIRLTKRVPA